MKIFALIPAYNEEESIQSVISECLQKTSNIVVVVDGSTDNTLDIVRGFENQITILINEKNVGLTQSMKRGFKYCLDHGCDAVIKIDGDRQMNIDKWDKIVLLYKKEKPDIISACFNKDTPWMIKKDIFIYSFLFFLASGIRLKDIISEYRLFSRKAVSVFINSKINNSGSNLSIINMAKEGCEIAEINDGVNYRSAKRRPAHINILIDCRVQFIKGLWNLGNVRSRMVSLLSILIMLMLLVFNITVGYKYNSIYLKKHKR